ncbi:MAG: DUF222 domain-containing protein [Actinomycetes bacterium]
MAVAERRMRALLPGRRVDLLHEQGHAVELVDRTLGHDEAARVLDEIARLERRVAALQARQVELLARFERMGDGGGPREFATDEVAARMRWTAWTAQRRMADAEALTNRLPRTLELLASGRLDYARVRAVVSGTAELDDACAGAVDAAVATVAPDLTTSQIAERVALEALAVDADAAARRAARARRGRRVGATPLPDGMAQLVAEGPAEDVAVILQGLTRAAAATADADDERGVDARRFDLLADWGRSLLVGADTPATSGDWRPVVLVTMSAAALLGLRDDPAHLQGYGPLPASVARQIAARGRLRRLLTDDVTGAAIGLDGHDHPGAEVLAQLSAHRKPPDEDPPDDGPPDEDPPGGVPPGGPSPAGAPPPTPARDHAVPAPSTGGGTRCPTAARGGGRYRPRRLVDLLVRLRDGTCTMPGCRRQAVRCDVDHLLRWPEGPTCPCNLHPLCRRHHRLKHDGGTTVQRAPDGTTTWRLRTGHEYVRPPRPALAMPTVRPVAGGRPGGVDRAVLISLEHDRAAGDLARLTAPPPAPAEPRDDPPPF